MYIQPTENISMCLWFTPVNFKVWMKKLVPRYILKKICIFTLICFKVFNFNYPFNSCQCVLLYFEIKSLAGLSKIVKIQISAKRHQNPILFRKNNWLCSKSNWTVNPHMWICPIFFMHFWQLLSKDRSDKVWKVY